MTDLAQSQAGSRLSGPWLTLARLGWLALTAAVVALWITTLRLDPQAHVAVFYLGMPLGYFAIAFFIFWRKSDDGMGLLVSLMLVFLGPYLLSGLSTSVGAWPELVWKIINAALESVGILVIGLCLCLFPDGRFVPAWSRWLAGLTLIVVPLIALVQVALDLTTLTVVAFMVVLGPGIGAQAQRFRHFSSPTQRQQVKWILVGFSGPLVGFLFWLGMMLLNRPDLVDSAVGTTVATSSILLFPLAIAFSIFRYRLWEIDVVIKRTVQYTLISGAGFILYLLAVGGTSLFLQQRNDLVAGLLVVVLLIVFFNPARQRLQTIMDKWMPYTPPPPEALAELEQDAARAAAESQHANTLVTPSPAERPPSPPAEHAGAKLARGQAGEAAPTTAASPLALGLVGLLFLAAVVCGLTGVGLFILNRGVSVPPTWGTEGGVRETALDWINFLTPALVTPLVAGLLGALVVARRPHNPIGWSLAAISLSFGLVAFTGEATVFTHFTLASPPPNSGLAALLLNTLWIIPYGLLILTVAIFPNGRFLSHRWRWVMLGALALFVIPMSASSLVETPLMSAFRLPNPLVPLPINGLPEALAAVGIPFMLLSLLLALAILFVRYRQTDQVERQQIKWLLVSITAMVVIFGSGVALTLAARSTSLGQVLITISVAFPLAGIGIAILRYRLYDIDIVIKRTVQYAVITAAGFVVYLLAVGGTSLFLQSRNDFVAGGLALGAVGVGFFWLRPRLEKWLNTFMPLPPAPAAVDPPFRPVPEEGLQSEPTMSPRISNNWQRLVRAAWVVLTLNSVWAVGWTLVYTWDMAHRPSPRIAAGLAALNLSPALYFWINALPITLMFLAYAVVAVVLFWRRPNDRMALFVAVFMMAFGVANAYPMAPEYLRVWETGGLHYVIPFAIANFLSWPLLVVFFALYPDGVFVPGWMRYVAAYGFAFSAAWGAWPQLFGQPEGLFGLFVNASIIFVFGSSLYAQVHRYRHHATPLQRQQIKWMVYGIGLVSLVIAAQVVTALLQPAPTPAQSLQRELVFMPLNLLFAILPIALGLAIMRYRLFEMHLLIRRTLQYVLISGFLALGYFGAVALLQRLSEALTGPQSNLVVVLITLGIVALFNPLRRRFQVLIDRAFYREKVDFRQAFTAFAREVRTIIDLQDLLRTLVNRTTELLHITHGAVYLEGLEDERLGELRLAEGRNLPAETETLTLEATMLERLRGGHTISRPGHKVFPLLVPLIAPVTQSPNRPITQSLIGVLALGPRLSDQAYSQEDQTLLTGLADQAGTAVYVAQLIQEQQAEAQRIEAAERRLEAFAHSPAGRAEHFALALLSDRPQALSELHALTEAAGTDPDAAALLEPLPAALTNLNAPTLAGLADGYRYIFASQSAPELLPVGLRALTDQLAQLEAPEALALYRLCQEALEASSISSIVEQGLVIGNYPLPVTPFLKSLLDGLQALVAAAEALRAYERVDAQQDKLAYLANAVERLTHADRVARAELGAADRPIVQRIAANWLTVVTGAMSELQTRARLVCRLLTRHTWTGEIIAVALAVRNEGRGAALNLKVTLAPAPEYTLVDESVVVERLAAGEETQAELRVRPHLSDKTGTTGGAGAFRARFVIVYADPRGPDQTENFADVVYLLAPAGEFKFIPNPYVVGTPLQTGSALFCGREDVFGFIQENLAAAHQNNLVLIGQRRTGKTSLLKQLPARLGEKYVPVYLDGQSLALDPGLPNFFYSLATEIAFALEDRGLAVGDLPDFTDSPATTFERKFLARVREALGERHLLLLLDEFEELEGAVRRGNLDVSVFGFLRHLIQHSQNLSVIFCGTHRMEELAADYWSVLFNISLYRHVAFLQTAEAFKLIQEPVAGYGMKYDDLALDKMWRVTAGHPYFLQLLCHSLVNQHNKSKRNYITVADVNAALDEILASGEAHFIFLWTESTHAERLVLTALSRMMALTGQANPAQVADYLAERGVPLDRRAVSDALHHLALRDTLRVRRDLNDGGSAETFSWQLGLLGLWVEKYKSLSRVVDETK